jgi:hypothetical protein
LENNENKSFIGSATNLKLNFGIIFNWRWVAFFSVFFWLIEIVSHSVIRAKVMPLECKHNFLTLHFFFSFVSCPLSLSHFFQTLPKLISIRLFQFSTLSKPFLQCDNTCCCKRDEQINLERNWVTKIERKKRVQRVRTKCLIRRLIFIFRKVVFNHLAHRFLTGGPWTPKGSVEWV